MPTDRTSSSAKQTEVGRVIRSLRERSGYSQAELTYFAKLSSPSILSRTEAGLTLPSHESALAIAMALGAEEAVMQAYRRDLGARKPFNGGEPAKVLAVPPSLSAYPAALVPPDLLKVGVAIGDGLAGASLTQASMLAGADEQIREQCPDFTAVEGLMIALPDRPQTLAVLCCQYSPRDKPTEEVVLQISSPIDAQLSGELIDSLSNACTLLSSKESLDSASIVARISACFARNTEEIKSVLELNRPRWQMFLPLGASTASVHKAGRNSWGS